MLVRKLIILIGTLIAVLTVSAVAVSCSPSAQADPDVPINPITGPQIGDFVWGTLNCTGDIDNDGQRFVEFSGTWQGTYNAQIELVEFKNNQELPVSDSELFSGVDATIQLGTYKRLLLGTGNNSRYNQDVVFTLKPVDINREFGVRIKWASDEGNSNATLLARWTPSERYKCGVPAILSQPSKLARH